MSDVRLIQHHINITNRNTHEQIQHYDAHKHQKQQVNKEVNKLAGSQAHRSSLEVTEDHRKRLGGRVREIAHIIRKHHAERLPHHERQNKSKQQDEKYGQELY